MTIQDIQAAVIECRKGLQRALQLIEQCEDDLQDQNNIDDLQKKLQKAGELDGILAAAAEERELEAVG